MTPLSARAARHLDLAAAPALDTPAARGRALAQLLEHGDREDLAELFATVPRAEARGWVRRHGGRRLSRRSRAFWAAVLEVEPSAPPPVAERLWPLA